MCATHSPPLTALPGADIVEVGEHGMRRVAWRELAVVDHWRRYLADPVIVGVPGALPWSRKSNT